MSCETPDEACPSLLPGYDRRKEVLCWNNGRSEPLDVSYFLFFHAYDKPHTCYNRDLKRKRINSDKTAKFFAIIHPLFIRIQKLCLSFLKETTTLQLPKLRRNVHQKLSTGLNTLIQVLCDGMKRTSVNNLPLGEKSMTPQTWFP